MTKPQRLLPIRVRVPSSGTERIAVIRRDLDAQDQGDAHLSAHQEPSRCAVAARSLQVGIDGAIPGIEVDDALEISEQTEI
jgi:hypothetical protein